MTKPNDTLKRYWRSLEDRRVKTRLKVLGPQNAGGSSQEFPPGADELVIGGGASRRKFMGLLGASTALAGLTGCGARKPPEYIMAHTSRPEDHIPGQSEMYATAAQFGGTVLGLLVESADGRPIKVEGNPDHPSSNGKTNGYAQASVLELYDPERSRRPRSTLQAVHYSGAESEEQARELAKEALCKFAEERIQEETKSLDRARQAAEECKTGVEEGLGNGKARFSDVGSDAQGHHATLTYEGNEQLPSDWNTAWQTLDALFGAWKARKGNGVGLVVDNTMSPSLRALLRDFAQGNPGARLFINDVNYAANTAKAAQALGGPRTQLSYDLVRAERIVAVDSDFLGSEADSVRLTGEFTRNRRLENDDDTIRNRLYAIESNFSVTGAAADNRLRIKSSEVGTVLALVAIKLIDDEKLAVQPVMKPLARQLQVPGKLADHVEAFATALAKDLSAHPTTSVVIVGERQPPAVHAIGHLVNGLIGAFTTQGQRPLAALHFEHESLEAEGIADLAAAIEAGEITDVVCLGTNPAYDAPGTLGMADKLAGLDNLVHAGLYVDETAVLASWHIPVSHYLEAWGDLESTQGVLSIQQPLIEPLHDTPSLLEFAWRLVNVGDERTGHEIIKAYWAREFGREIDERTWAKWLHDGLVTGVPREPNAPTQDGWSLLAGLMRDMPQPIAGDEVNFIVDYHTMGGRFSNSGWLLELPHPMTKLVWDNAALMGPTTAARLGVQNGDIVDIKVGGTAMSLPVWILPGTANDAVTVSLGQGREGLGVVAQGAGFDNYPAWNGEWFAEASVSRGAGRYDLVSTQDYGSLDPDGPDGTPLGLNYPERPLYRETDVEGYAADPDFAQRGDLMPKTRLESLWDRPTFTGKQQWGMVIDLNTCTGCAACVMACQAENNIPVVGKDMCANGRELHWIRMDRYFRGSEDNPTAAIQFVGCQHCEAAPCETVCPVAATTHSPEGLNDMAYNRCIGTRYCANNCPYKVRRFNYFNFNDRLDPLEMMQKNPDVSVRFRGVMEKCSYCVQRIQQAKIEAHTAGEDTVKDGVIVSACEQACPAEAITFGDVADPTTKVAKLKASRRNYTLLADLNTTPRTSYLGRIRNPNPELKPVENEHEQEQDA